MTQKISLTGIKPSGIPHIGNYFGAIKPALELVTKYEARYFIADYHALNMIKDPDLLREQSYDLAATWLACGLNPEKVLFYRQSDVRETFELSTILMAFTPKGLMNRAHAYKAHIAFNQDSGKDVDEGINMGLFTYPVLMAADILLFNTNLVPVGKDQKQHVEMTADIAQTVNRAYQKDLLVIPKPLISEETQIITGLDGRKMSKSYNNVIPLFLPAKKFRKIIMKIVTNSQGIEESKDPDKSSIFSLYKLFANPIQIQALRERYIAGGMGWGHAKQDLFDLMEAHFSGMRDDYDKLIKDRAYLDETLKKGAEKASEIACATVDRLRTATGIGR